MKRVVVIAILCLTGCVSRKTYLRDITEAQTDILLLQKELADLHKQVEAYRDAYLSIAAPELRDKKK
jgi:hypothetical protein